MPVNKPRDCPACGGTNRRFDGRKNGFDIFTCAVCGTIYTGSLPSAGNQIDYDEYYNAENLSTPEFITARVREIVAQFADRRQNGRFLDVGFGSGTILDAAAGQSWDVYGLEVSMPAIEQARSRGYEVFYGTLAEAAYPTDFFDVITASEIVEHLHSPVEELKEIARILRPGGLFWATTPSAQGISVRMIGSAWSVIAPPDHTQLYSKAGIRKLYESAGLRVTRIDSFGTNPFEIIQHFRENKSGETDFNRVGSAYSLNESLNKSRSRKLAKSLINNSLNLVGLGDSLKIYATTD